MRRIGGSQQSASVISKGCWLLAIGSWPEAKRLCRPRGLRLNWRPAAQQIHMEPQIKTETNTKAEANVQQAVPFFGVSNMETSLSFYVDGLGFAMTKKWTPDGPDKVRWCWLQHGNAALMLQEFKKDHHPNSGRPEGKLGVGVSICFQCNDALAIYREITSRGIQAKRLSWEMPCGSHP